MDDHHHLPQSLHPSRWPARTGTSCRFVPCRAESKTAAPEYAAAEKNHPAGSVTPRAAFQGRLRGQLGV
jgi:hypothetical protein